MINLKAKTIIETFDGGGINGQKVAYYKQNLSKFKKSSLLPNMYVGTSTGAILATLYALGYSADEVVGIYEKLGKEVFKRRSIPSLKFARAKYAVDNLRDAVYSVLGDKTFADVPKGVILAITAFDITNGKRCVFRNTQQKYLNFKLADAVIASCPAPSLFDAYRCLGVDYIDGAMGGVNNPSIVAYDVAVRELGLFPDNLILTSYATGRKPQDYNNFRFWQLWDVPEVIDLLLSQSQENDHNQMRQKKGVHYQRIVMGSGYASGELDDTSSENARNMKLDSEKAYIRP
jgi:patatin-like phospholipase/acyl hydrolase